MAAPRSSTRYVLTELVLKVFRLNGRFLDAADRITEGSGLTAARWQVLGAVLHEPLTVAAVARSMGLTRQSVQRLADILVEEGMCEFLLNPAHVRAKLLAPTERGWAAIKQIRPRVTSWAKRIGAIVGDNSLSATNSALDAILAAVATTEGCFDAPAQHRMPGKRGCP
jgi:DNA-binding MarR family transcriptional regulator